MDEELAKKEDIFDDKEDQVKAILAEISRFFADEKDKLIKIAEESGSSKVKEKLRTKLTEFSNLRNLSRDQGAQLLLDGQKLLKDKFIALNASGTGSSCYFNSFSLWLNGDENLRNHLRLAVFQEAISETSEYFLIQGKRDIEILSQNTNVGRQTGGDEHIIFARLLDCNVASIANSNGVLSVGITKPDGTAFGANEFEDNGKEIIWLFHQGESLDGGGGHYVPLVPNEELTQPLAICRNKGSQNTVYDETLKLVNDEILKITIQQHNNNPNPHPQPQTYTAQAIFEEQEQEVQTASEPVSSAPSSNFSSPSTIPNPTTPQSNETPNNSPSSSSDSSSYSGSFGGFSSGGGGGGGSSSSSPSPSAPETTPPSTPPTPSPSPTPRPPVYPSADEAQEILKTAKKVQKETNASLEEIKKATDNLNNLLEKLDQLTTSQAVAQYVKQVTSQIQQQKLTTQKKTNLSQKPSEKK
ncbi:22226_t:CDS:2 [Entrophospora sp. SA101]|nr:22226_t:CDS:2 [Entrophospora sp. SA101]